MIKIVSATRLSEHEFWSKAALGISLRRLAQDTRLIVHIAFENSRGLSTVFNESINVQDSSTILVFIHDDVWIDDQGFEERVLESFDTFDVVGVAGVRHSVIEQPAWSFKDETFTWISKEDLSGSVAHSKYPFGEISSYGESPSECELLDGVFIAVHKTMLMDSGLRFDTSFDFHFYDLDFCRSARAIGLKIGTWPISLTHQSGGAFGSLHWKKNYQIYLKKWKGFVQGSLKAQNTINASAVGDSTKQNATFLQCAKKLIYGSQNINRIETKTQFTSVVLPPLDLQNECAEYKKRGNDYLSDNNLDSAAECYGHALAINPKDPDLFLNLGIVLKEKSQFQFAIHYLSRAIALSPQLVDAYYFLGLAYQGKGDEVAAAEQFNVVLKLNPDFELAYGDLGNAYLRNGDVEAAKSILLKGQALYPQNADLFFIIGNVYSYAKDFDSAIDALSNALSLDPNFIEARGNWGNILQSQGKLDEAIEQFRIALSQMPDYAEFHNNLGYALQLQGKLDEAANSYYKAIALKSDIDVAHLNLLSVLHSQGKLTEAEQHYCLLLSRKPNDGVLLANLGSILHAQEKFDEAIDRYRQALLLNPNFPDLHNNLGSAFQEKGMVKEALESYRQAILYNPNYSKAHWNLVNLLRSQGQLDAEIAHYRSEIKLNPTTETYQKLGYALRAHGRLEEAVEHFQLALADRKTCADAHSDLGDAYLALNKPEQAEDCFRQAVSLKPHDCELQNKLAGALQFMGRLDEAIQCYRQAILLKPNSAFSHNNLAQALHAQGRFDEAIESYRHALMITPDDLRVFNNYLVLLSGDARCTAANYLTEVKRFGAIALAQARPYLQWPVCFGSTEGQPLRVGLVSGDFKRHPVGFFIESILAYLDSSRITLIAYPTIADEDDLTRHIKTRCSAWVPITGMTGKEAAKRIYQDNIHILIDLAGHTGYNGLPVFAWKPAPIQVSWLGFYASTGVPGMDYLLADPVSIPESHQTHFTEQIWYLPDTRLCFTVPSSDPSLIPPPPPILHNGYITFGCFQRLTKLSVEVLELWGRILHALPQAKLRLQNNEMHSAAMREEILQRMHRAGIDTQRIILEAGAPRHKYLLAHADVDIILDTFPYTGGTTTCEALWMGVPTLTIAGNNMLSRQGASLMSCCGLSDWVANNAEEYFSHAIAHASDIPQLTKLRATLRQQVLDSPLFDAPQFARNLEDVLEAMWARKMGN